MNHPFILNMIIVVIQRDLIRSLWRSRWGVEGGGCRGNSKQFRIGLAEKLNASRTHGIMGGRFEIKEVLSGSGTSTGRLALSWARLPQGCLDDPAAAACISQGILFWMGRNSRSSLGSGSSCRGLFFFGCSRGNDL